MSTKEQPGPFDGLERAEPGEPVFTLRAHDALAAPLVREWVEQRRKAILAANLPDDKRSGELVQAREAEAIAERMEEWRAGDGVPTETPTVHYSGKVDTAAELKLKGRHDVIRHVVTRLHNSVAEIADAARALDDLDDDGLGLEISTLAYLSDALKKQAFNLEPKRGGR